MSRDRFLLLLKFLHVADNSVFDPVDPNRDRIYKIRPFFDIVTDRFKAVYSPKRELCVDESLVLFKGRVSLKQFNVTNVLDLELKCLNCQQITVFC